MVVAVGLEPSATATLPSQATGTTRAQRFFYRTRTLLPTKQNLLKPDLNLEAERLELRDRQKNQEKAYNKRAKDLPPPPPTSALEGGDIVRMKPFQMGEKKWSKAVATNRPNKRSYEVEVEYVIYRRNRVYLKETSE